MKSYQNDSARIWSYSWFLNFGQKRQIYVFGSWSAIDAREQSPKVSKKLDFLWKIRICAQIIEILSQNGVIAYFRFKIGKHEIAGFDEMMSFLPESQP